MLGFEGLRPAERKTPDAPRAVARQMAVSPGLPFSKFIFVQSLPRRCPRCPSPGRLRFHALSWQQSGQGQRWAAGDVQGPHHRTQVGLGWSRCCIGAPHPLGAAHELGQQPQVEVPRLAVVPGDAGPCCGFIPQHGV